MSSKGRCIVYGGGGFIGSNLVESLLKSGYPVTAFDKLNFSRKNILEFTNDIEIIEGDFYNEVDLKNSLNGIEFVYHLVSSTIPATSNKNPVYDAETNLISTLHLLEECVSKKIKKVIFISSGGTVYGVPETIPVKETQTGNPICSYGIIKKTIEEYLFMFNKLYNLDYNVFRLSNPYGVRQNPKYAQGAVTVFLYKALNDIPIEIWGDGSVVRDYIYISDVVDVLVKSLTENIDEKCFNLSSGKGISINELLEKIKSVVKKELIVNYTSARKEDVPVNILDNELVTSRFGIKPVVDIEEGLKRTANYLERYDG